MVLDSGRGCCWVGITAWLEWGRRDAVLCVVVATGPKHRYDGSVVSRLLLTAVLLGAALIAPRGHAEPAKVDSRAEPAKPDPRAEPTLLQWTKQRILSEQPKFEDEPVVPEELLRPMITRERGLALLGVATGTGYFRAPDQRVDGNDVRLEGELRLAVDTYEPVAGMIGKTSRVGLRVAFGGGSDSAHSEVSGAFATGAMVTFGDNGGGGFARVLGGGATVLEPGRSAILAHVGVPVGYLLDQRDWHFEVALLPALGWTTVVVDDVNRGTGPLYLGGTARLDVRGAWLDGEYLKSLIEGDVDSTRLSACGFIISPVALCADGWWLSVHDIANDEPASFARVGLRLSVGSTRESEGKRTPRLLPTR